MDWLVEDDGEVIHYALMMWINVIETGDYRFGAMDIGKCSKGKKVKALSIDQMKLILRLHDLAKRRITDE